MTVKRLLCVLLATVMLFAVTACKSEKEKQAACHHDFAAASCQKPKTCKLCGFSEGAPMHQYLDATCQAPKTCKACGLTTGALGDHPYDDATCQVPKTCPLCGATDGDVIDHIYADADCSTPMMCTMCGKTVGTPSPHDFAEATCDAPERCTVCGRERGKALGHDMAAATCDKPKSCTRCDKTEGEALGHTYAQADCTTPQLCTRCGETGSAMLGHSYTRGVCSRCGHKDPYFVLPVETLSFGSTAKSVYIGEAFTLNPRITPSDATHKTLSWSSSDTNIASVDGEGMIKARRQGSCVITATAPSGASCSLNLTVKANVAEICTLDLPDTSFVVSHIVGGQKQSACKITDITYTFSDAQNGEAALLVSITAEKHFERHGSATSEVTPIGMTLYNSQNDVVISGQVDSPIVTVGDTFVVHATLIQNWDTCSPGVFSLDIHDVTE